MTEINDKPDKPAAPEDAHGLEDKMQDYHREGGSRGNHHARRIESEIISAGIAANDDLKKGRPPSRPQEHD